MPQFSKILVRYQLWWRLAGGILLIALVVWGIKTGVYWTMPLDVLSDQASEARLHGDNKTALKLYRIVSARASKFDFSSNYELGNIYQELGQWRRAEYHYLRATDNASSPISLFYQLEELYLRHLPERADRFPPIIQKRLTTDADNHSIMALLAEFYQQRGDKTQALDWYKKALALDPTNRALQEEVKSLETP